MNKEIFFYTPNVPMFLVCKDCCIVRARVIRYSNGRFDGALVDVNAFETSVGFADLEEFLPDAQPFYCAHLSMGGEMEIDQMTIKEMAKLAGMTEEKVAKNIAESMEKVCCPFIQNEDDARQLVFNK